MARNVGVTFLTLLGAITAFAADAPSVAKVWASQLSNAEQEVVSLVEAMPADKFAFHPTGAEFTKVRTFSQQATHIGAVIYAVSAAVLGEKNPTDMGASENGPETVMGKAAVVKYLKEAFAYGQKAMNSLTRENEYNMIKSAFGDRETPRIAMASVAVWHSFDHYGQMVIYARMNGIVPPASR